MNSAVAFHQNMVIVFFFYGLAFFTMGLAIALEWRSDSNLPFSKALPLLSVFSFVHGLAEWTYMLALIRTQGLARADVAVFLAIAAVLAILSFFFLFWFAVDLLNSSAARSLAPLAFLLWVAALIGVGAGRAPGETDWPALASSLSRYLIGLPGGLLATHGLLRQRRIFQKLGMSTVAADCRWVGLSFGFYSLVMGMVGERAPYFPASIVNYGSFLSTVGLPVQLFRTILALIIAYLVVRVLRAYEMEQRRRLDQAAEERHQAQQEALEAYRRTEEQLRSWNEALEQRLWQRAAELERREQESKALYAISTAITAGSEQDCLVSSVVDRARDLVEADLAALALWDEGENALIMRATSGARTEKFRGLRVHQGEGLVGQVAATGEPLAVDDYLVAPELCQVTKVDAAVAAEELKAQMAVPLHGSGKLLGVLLVANRSTCPFSADNRWLLSRLAVVTAIAIETARLYGQARQLAVLEERERIGREIHDGLAQVLGYLGMVASSARRHLAEGAGAKVAADLQEMERLAQEAYADAREAILGLQISAFAGPGLEQALREYTHRFGEQSGVPARVVVREGWQDNLAASVEVQIVRVVQQALSNVRRHANASSVSVEFGTIDGCVEVAVADDGRGFDPKEYQRGDGRHFGLQTMHERIHSIGGALLVESVSGRGTRVAIRLPKPNRQSGSAPRATTAPSS